MNEDPSFEVSLVHKIDANGLSVNGINHRAMVAPSHDEDEEEGHWDDLMNGGDWSPERCALAEKTKRKWLQKASSTKGLIGGGRNGTTHNNQDNTITVNVENSGGIIKSDHQLQRENMTVIR